MYEWTKTYFAEYEAFTENEISKITKNGIFLKNGVFIDFAVCAENLKKQNPQSGGKCVGEHKITDFSFTFFASPKPIMIKFIQRNKLIEFFSKNNTLHRFHSLQRKINDFGFTTYDIS